MYILDSSFQHYSLPTLKPAYLKNSRSCKNFHWKKYVLMSSIFGFPCCDNRGWPGVSISEYFSGSRRAAADCLAPARG